MIRISLIALIGVSSLVLGPPLLAQEKTMTTSTGMELVWIPPGEFMQGSTQQEQAWAVSNTLPAGLAKCEGEQPRRAKITKGFWLGRTEVTVGQWRKFAESSVYITEAERNGTATTRSRDAHKWGPVKGVCWKDLKLDVKPKENYPACCISWNDAMAFCQWLTATEKRANRLAAGMIARLPTEAEWEYACRAGTQTKFWWGEMPAAGDHRLNWSISTEKIEGPSPAGHFRAKGFNKFGLTDMLGNAWEWCLDVADPAQAHEECYKTDSEIRVLRGGGYFSGPEHCRCAARRLLPASSTNIEFGFRVAIGVSP